MSTVSANKLHTTDVRHHELAFNAPIFMESRSAGATQNYPSALIFTTIPDAGTITFAHNIPTENESKIITFSKFEYKETFEIRKGNGQSR